ncbi:PAS domain S-box-containing protein [Pantoea ananatis]|nr:PAS domain S-box-containing protein [Pantoea ananatis]
MNRLCRFFFNQVQIRLNSSVAVSPIAFSVSKTETRRNFVENQCYSGHDFKFDTMNDAIYIIDKYGKIIYLNPKACSMIGYTREEITNLHFSVVDKELKDSDVLSLWWKLSIRQEGIKFTSQHCTKKDELIPVEVNSSRYQLNTDTVVFCIVRDQRKLTKLTQHLVQEERKFRTLVENSPDLIIRFDKDFSCIYCNSLGLKVMQSSFFKAGNWKLTDIVSYNSVGANFFSSVSMALATGEKNESEIKFTMNGNIRLLHIHCVPESRINHQIDSVLIVGRDITRMREAEKELREAHKQIQQLAHEQEKRSESLRKNIARDIHDELGQYLSTLRNGLSLISMQAQSPALVDRQVLKMTELVDTTLKVLRDISTRLRPNPLNMGLIPTLEWLRDDFIKNNSCACILIIPKESSFRISDTITTTVFRVVQESLTNVIRHAEATRVYIIMEKNSKNLIVKVRDNGRGFKSTRNRPNSFGILGMKERLTMLEGRLDIKSEVDKGTTIELTIPLNDRED